MVRAETQIRPRNPHIGITTKNPAERRDYFLEIQTQRQADTIIVLRLWSITSNNRWR